MTGRSEKTPARLPASTTRAARASTSAGAADPASTRRRSASRTSRTMDVKRARGNPLTVGRPFSARRTWSTEGRLRRAVGSAFTESRLDLGADAADDLLRLRTPGLGGPAAFTGHRTPAHRLFGEATPQLVE